MNKITFPLNSRMQGSAVADLQDALQLLLDRGAILADNERARRVLSEDLKPERAEQTYGQVTYSLVRTFQSEKRLQATGEVSEATAKAMNALLQEWGLLDQEVTERIINALDAKYAVPCLLVDAQGQPIAGLRVQAFDQDPKSPHDPLDETLTTDAEGTITIRFKQSDFTEHPGEKGPDLYFKIYRGNSLLSYTLPKDRDDNGVLRSFKPQPNPITIQIDKHCVVEGYILRENGLPAQDLELLIYNRGFGGQDTLLSEDRTKPKTNEQGYYALAYNPGGTGVNLEVRIKDPKDAQKEIPLSKPKYRASIHETLNLVAPTVPLEAEYRRLSADLTAYLGERKLTEAREDSDRQDLTVLNRATGWDARLIALSAITERMAADPDVPLPQEILYGLFRAGLPSDKLMLAQVGADAVEQALKKVRDANIIGLDDPEIEEVKQKFATFSNEVRLKVPAPGSQSTYGDLLKSSGISAQEQQNFAAVYLNHRGDATKLWEKARKKVEDGGAGLDDTQISKLQLQGKLAFLTGNSEKLTSRLQQSINTSDPVQLVEENFYQTDPWINEINAMAKIPANRRDNLTNADKKKLEALIPPMFVGETVEARRKFWAEDMARKVRLSYSTQVLGHKLENDNADQFGLGETRTATATLLKNGAAQGFRLGQTPVEAFFSSHVGARADMTDAEFNRAKQQMKTLQCIYQITPTDEAMPVLTSLGITSAYDVMAYSEEVFLELYIAKYLELYGQEIGTKEAKLVYSKATQVSSVTYNLFPIAQKLDTEVPVFGMSASADVRDSVKNELIKHYPTMESLFGSMDFCECEHCRSVLSPAAYLVDLLQFVDVEPNVWNNFLTKWKEKHDKDYTDKYKNPYDALIERRPDLPYIQLTCENTHTALPYIDIVNEILEYYVANDKLTEDAAHDTGEATTAELLAEPQNVIREAYDKLREAKYPLTLPFDLWLETVRQFCNYFETPLSELLEVFRRSDDLFDSSQTYDRARIFIESLEISPAEFAIFSDPNPLTKWYELYGFKTAAEAKTIATDADTKQRIDLNSAKALSRRLGVTYKEVVEIVQTGFVNPQLDKLVILYKLGVSIQSVLFCRDLNNKNFYDLNQDLLDKERRNLSASDRQRFDALSQSDWQTLKEVQAFEQRIQDFVDKRVDKLQVQQAQKEALRAQLTDQIERELQVISFDDILVLADPDAGCNFDRTTLRYASGRAADDIAFLKINFFVRLWRKLGWTIEETDRALVTFLPKNAPFESAHLNKQPLKTALIYMAHLKTLDETVSIGKQSRLKLMTLWSDMATTGKNSLYAQLFLTRSILKSDDVFDHPLGRYLAVTEIAAMAQVRKHTVQLENVALANKIDPTLFNAEPKLELSYDDLQEVQYITYQGVLSDAEKTRLEALLPASTVLSTLLDVVQRKAQEFSLVKGHLLALQGALGLTADEIRRILEDADKSIDTAELSLAHVSLLYRYGLLAKALKLSVRELISLRQLSGLNPFQSVHVDQLTQLDEDYPFTQTLRFVEVTEEVKESGLKIEDLEYLLRHQFDETGKYRQNREGTLALLKTLSEGVRAIRTEHPMPKDPGVISDEVIRQKLGLVFPPDVVARFLSMMNGTAEFTATKVVASAEQLNPLDFIGDPAIIQLTYNATKQEQRIVFRGVLSDTQKQEFKDKFSAKLTESQQTTLAGLLDAVQTQANAFFVKYLEKQQLNASVTTGFLETTDFNVLFAPLPEIGDNLTEAQKEAAIKANEEKRKKKLVTLLGTFFPFLQQNLIRQFIVKKMTAETEADPVLVESLLNDERLLGDPNPLLDRFAVTSERGLTATFFLSDDAKEAPLRTVTLNDSDIGLQDKDGNPLRPPNAKSARLEGYLEVHTSGVYRFYVALDKQNAEAELWFAHLVNPTLSGAAQQDGDELGDGPDEYVELKPGIPYHFTLTLRKLNGGEARLLVQGETLPKDKLTQLTLYPMTAFENAERAIVLLSKVLKITQELGLSERELRYLLTHPDQFDNLDLKTLPCRNGEQKRQALEALQQLETIADDKKAADPNLTDQQAMIDARNEHPDLVNVAAQPIPLFQQFLRLAEYTRLKRDLASGTDDLIEVFEANQTADLNKVYPLIAKLTRRDEATIKATAKLLFTRPTFASEKPLQRLWEALQVIERFGVPVTSLFEWTHIISPATTPEQRFDIARDMRAMVKARFEPETWQRVAQPIFDKLRQRQRDALVALIMYQHGFARMDQLYEYFLIDPGMEPVVQTSRIRLAISSLQLFIQRCLLNLEKNVHPSAIINAKQWEWMKRYRIWEANRKIFLFPENWLEPEFRDDKTHLFTELEGSLLQGDVSSDLVEDAFLNYLKKLEELARLDIVAMHLEDKVDPAQNTLHVIGRTFNQPHNYFYRRYAHQMWTPWEPVTAEIEGDHLAPVIWRDRLYLFWVTFFENAQENSSEQTFDPTKEITIPGVQKGIQVKLHWSEYLQGKWNTGESGEFIQVMSNLNINSLPTLTLAPLFPLVPLIVPSNFDKKSVFIHVSVSYDPHTGEERGVYIHLEGDIRKAFFLSGRNSSPELLSYNPNGLQGTKPTNPYSANTASATRYSGSGDLTVTFKKRTGTEIKPETQKILKQSISEHKILLCNNNISLGALEYESTKAAKLEAVPEIDSLRQPVFYMSCDRDKCHDTLFIEPNVAERTIPEWPDWVPQPEPDYQWSQDTEADTEAIVEAIPENKPIPEPPEIYPEAVFKYNLKLDWLVNRRTAFLFDGNLIGPKGRAGEIRPYTEVAGTIIEGSALVNVHAGSEIATGNIVILAAGTTLEKIGMEQAASGLNVVGSGGFNSSLAQNFNAINQEGFGISHVNVSHFTR